MAEPPEFDQKRSNEELSRDPPVSGQTIRSSQGDQDMPVRVRIPPNNADTLNYPIPAESLFTPVPTSSIIENDEHRSLSSAHSVPNPPSWGSPNEPGHTTTELPRDIKVDPL
jgi:hypothetical protein